MTRQREPVDFLKRSATIIVFILVVLEIISCQNYDNKKDQLTICDLNLKVKDGEIEISEVFNVSIDYVPLQTQKDISISGIHSIKMFDNNLFVNTLDEILCFSWDGRFIRKIGNKGKGPNEYISIHDFSFNAKEQCVYILSGWQDKILVYSKDNEFKKAIPCPEFTTKIVCFDDFIFCYNQNIDGRIINSFEIIGYDGKIRKQFKNKNPTKRIENPIILGDEVLFATYEDKIYVKELYSDTVFVLNGSEVKPLIVFNHNDKTFPAKVKEQMNVNSFMEILSKYVIDLNLFIYESGVYYEYSLNGKTLAFIKNEKTKIQTIFNSENGIVNDIDGGPAIRIKGLMDNKTFVSWVNAYELKEYVGTEKFKSCTPKFPEKKKELEALANRLNDNDNPVLMLVKLKE